MLESYFLHLTTRYGRIPFNIKGYGYFSGKIAILMAYSLIVIRLTS